MKCRNSTPIASTPASNQQSQGILALLLVSLIAPVALMAPAAVAGDPDPATQSYPRVASWRGSCGETETTVTVLDALQAARTGAGLIDIGTPVSQGGDCTLSTAACEAISRGCDIDDSGLIDVLDSLFIAQIDVGLIPAGIEATIINVVPHSPDPTGGVADPHPINDATPPNPLAGTVCVYYFLTVQPTGPAQADVIVEYSTLGGAPGTFLPATLTFAPGTTSPGVAHPTLVNVVRDVPTDPMGVAFRTVVWDTTADISLMDQLSRGFTDVVVRVRCIDDVDVPVVPGNVDRSQAFELGNFPPECDIQTPASTAIVSMDVDITYDLWDVDLVTTPWSSPPWPATDYQTATIFPEWSSDGGLTWSAMTESVPSASEGSSGLSMGTSALTPATHLFVWDSFADLGNLNITVSIRIRPQHDMDVFTGSVTANPAVATGNECGESPIEIINNTAPECVINNPAAGATVSGVTTLDFDIRDPGGDLLDVTWEYSIDAGATFSLLTPTGGGTLNTNPTLGVFAGAVPPVPPPFVNYTLNWDTAADVPGTLPVVLRLTLYDGRDTTTCTVNVTVDNTPICAITSPSAITLGGIVDIVIDLTDPSNDPVTVLFEYSTDMGATFNPATTAAGGTIVSNPSTPIVTPAIGEIFRWASGPLDIPTMSPVLFRATVTDVRGGTSTCTTTFDIDNRPTCANMQPTLASGVQSGVITVSFDTADPDGGPLDITLEYSTNTGMTFDLCTVQATGFFPANPALTVAPGFGQSFDWDSIADGLMNEPMTIVRLSVTDGATLVTCTTTFDVLNNVPPECLSLMVAPPNPDGSIPLIFDTQDINPGDMHTVQIDYTTDFGLTFALATPAVASPLTPNPTAPIAPGAGLTFIWDAALDVPGTATVEVVITLTDLGGLVSAPPCRMTFVVDNRPACQNPTGLTPVTGDYDFTVEIRDLSSDPLDLTWEFSTDSGLTFFPMTPAGASVNPTLGVATTPAFAPFLFQWDSDADVPGASMSTVLRVTLTDGTTTTSCEMVRPVSNAPTCAITSPIGGLFGGVIPVAVDVDDPATDPLTVTVEYSIDGGTTFALATDAGTGTLTPNPTAPLSVATPASLTFDWMSQSDIPGFVPGVIVRITVDDGLATSTCQTSFDVDNRPTCQITSPLGGTLAGDILIDWTANDPSMDPYDVTLELSTDSGATFFLGTVGPGGSQAVNPAVGVACCGPENFEWQSQVDGVASASVVVARLSITDAFGGTATCQTTFAVDNVPTCAITSPVGGIQSDVIPLDVATLDPSGDDVSLLVEYSLDGGLTFALATDAGTGSVTGNPTGTFPSSPSEIFDWNSQPDIPGMAFGVLVRITVTDLSGFFSTCTTIFDVVNGPMCSINAPSGTIESGIIPIDVLTMEPSALPLVGTFEFSTDSGATFASATDAGTGSILGNPSAPFGPSASDTFDWDSQADAVASAGTVIFRVTVDNGAGGVSTCQTTFAVDNVPTCSILPYMGLQAGTIPVDVITTDPSMDTVDVLIEFSTDFGATFFVATEDILLPGALTPNPALGVPGDGMTRDFSWDTVTDVPAQMASVIIRVTVTDPSGFASTCTQTVDIDNDNDPTCAIISPLAPGTLGGQVPILFDALDADGDALLITWEYSIDGGMTYFPMQAGVGSPLTNPALGVAQAAGLTFVWDSSSDLPITGCGAGGVPGCPPPFPVDVDLGSTCPAGTFLGDTTLAADDTILSCAFGGGPDDIYRFVVPLGVISLDISTDNPGTTYDTALGVFDCAGAELACDDDGGLGVTSLITLPVAGGQEIFISVEGFGGAVGQYELSIICTGMPPPGGPCVDLRVTVSDGAGVPAVCNEGLFDVDNTPSCANVLPTGVVIMGNQAFTFDAFDPDDTLTVTVRYSIDGGVTFAEATFDSGGGLPFNPATGVAPAAGLSFTWASGTDIQVDVFGVILEVEVFDGVSSSTCQTVVDVLNDQLGTCVITSPVGGVLGGVIDVTFDTNNPLATPVTGTFEWSTDFGTTWNLATDAGTGTVVGNPSAPFGPGIGDIFSWDSQVDGIESWASLIFRITIDNGLFTSTCQTVFDVDNRPTCLVAGPAGVSGGIIPVDVTPTDPSMDALDIVLEASIDGGITFFAMTDAGTGALTPNPALGVPGDGALRTFDWESFTDIPGSFSPVVVRVTVTDPFGFTSTCNAVLSVDNRATCLITAPAAGASIASDTSVVFDVVNPTGNAVTADFEYSINGGLTFAAASDAGTGALVGNPAGPFAAAVGLDWTWATATDIAGVVPDVVLRVRVTDTVTGFSSTCDVIITVDNRVTCNVTMPAGGATVSGDTSVVFDTTAASGNMVTAAFDFSLDSGVTFNPATDAATGTLAGNPTAPFVAAAGLDWTWMTATDVAGSATSVILRITVTDTGTGAVSTCRVVVDIDNTVTCNITAPASGTAAAGVVPLVFDVTSSSGNMVTAAFDYSINGGLSYAAATDDGTGALTGNPTAPFVAAAGLDWSWRSGADIPGSMSNVLVRITVTDVGTGASSTCTVLLDVDNLTTCTINLPTGGTVVGGLVVVDFDTTSATGADVIVDVEFSIDGGLTFAPATDAGSGSQTGNPAGPFPPGNETWDWQSDTDIPGFVAGAVVRLTVTDSVFGGTSTCSVVIDVENRVNCTITAPAPASVISGNQIVTFDVGSGTGNDVTADLEFSVNGGVTFALATDAGGGGLIGNPTPAFATPTAGETWEWASATDVPTGGTNVVFRVTVTDVITAAVSTCSVTVDIANNDDPTCAINSPLTPGTLGGDVAIDFDALDIDADPLSIVWEWTDNGGATWQRMTAAGTSPLVNPASGVAPAAGLLFTWDSAADLPSNAPVVELRVTVSDGQGGVDAICTEGPFDVENRPACANVTPVGGLQTGNIAVGFDATDPSDLLTVTMRYSSDGGVTFQLATVDAAGMLPANPAVGVVPAAGLSFIWASATDITTLVPGVVVEIEVFDGTTRSTCTTVFDVDNDRQVGCTLTSTAGPGVSDVVDFTVDTTDPLGGPLNGDFEFSTNGGITFQSATADGASPLANPTGPFGPAAGDTFLWDSQADGVGDVAAVIMRLSVTGVATMSTCSEVVDVTNVPTCSIGAFMGVQGGVVNVDVTTTDPSVDPVSVLIEYSTNSGVTFGPATDAATGILTPNPAVGVPGDGATRDFDWDSAADVAGTAPSVVLRVTVTDGAGFSSTCTQSLDVDNGVSCAITAPAPASVISSGQLITFDVTSGTGNNVTAAFDFSVNGGTTFAAATDLGGGSQTGNPTGAFAPAVGETWEWATSADIPGFVPGAIMRITVTDTVTGTTSTCTLVVDVDNRINCAITAPAPASLVGGGQLVTFDVTSATGNNVTAAFDFSVNGGTTFAAATDLGGGSQTGNPTAAFAPAVGETWEWDTSADIPGFVPGAILRITVTDAVTASVSICTLTVDVDNTPTCVITMPAAGSPITNFVLVGFTTTSPSGNPVIMDLTYSTNAGVTFLPATDFGGGSVFGNPTVIPAAAGAHTWEWDTSADILTDELATIFQVGVTDSVTGTRSTCTIVWDVLNQATCTIDAPAQGSTIAGDSLISFTTVQPSPNGLDLSFEYSLDGGATFLPATDAGGGSVSGNPVVGTAPGANTWEWATGTDVPISAVGVIFRLTITDSVFGGGTSTCERFFTVDNSVSCAITAPAPASLISAGQLVTFDVTSATGNNVTAAFDFSVNGGTTFAAATDLGGGSQTGNPTAAFAPAVGETWEWDTSADIPGFVPGAILRITVTDAVTASVSICTLTVDVDNTPTCVITMPAAGSPITNFVLVGFTTTSPSGNPVIMDLTYSTNAGVTFLPATDFGGGSVFGNPTVIPAAAGAHTWEWDTSADILTDELATIFQVGVTDSVTGTRSTCTIVWDVLNQATCTIDAPAQGSTIAGDSLISFTTVQPSPNGLDLSFEYSLDGGATFLPATDAGGGSVSGNPVVGTAPGANTWEWATGTDVPISAVGVIFRLTITDSVFGGGTSTCERFFTVDNSVSCAITAPAPASLISAGQLVTFDVTSATGNNVTAAFDFSVNGGTTFAAATDLGGGSQTGNPTAAFAPAVGETWEWDTSADIPGFVPGAILRITVTDAVTASVSICTLTVDVDNTPTCVITMPAAGSPITNFVLVGFTTTSPSGNPVIMDLTYSTNAGVTFLPATDFGGGSVFGNPTVIPAAAGAHTWEWDTSADILTDELATIFQVGVTDSVTGTRSTCTIVWDVLNQATCTIDAPAQGSTIAGDSLISFTTVQPSPNGLDLSFEYSLDGGATFLPATDAGGGSVSGNPVVGTAPGANTWEWATGTDVPISAVGVIFRLTITDSVFGGGTSTCERFFTVDNSVSCAITAPAPASLISAGQLVTFDVTSATGNNVTAAFDFSVNGGTTFAAATDLGGGSQTGNPTAAFAPAVGETWEWDTSADIPGFVPGAILRITVTDAVTASVSICTLTVDVDNRINCTITAPAPAATVTGNQLFTFDVTSGTGNNVAADLEYSVNGGVTFAAASDAGGGSQTGNPTGAFAPAVGETWQWDSATDVIGVAAGVVFRITITDSVTLVSSVCQVVVDVSNNTAPSCSAAPTIAGGATGGEVVIDFTTVDPDPGALLTVRVEYSTNGVTFNPVTVGGCAALMSTNPQSGLAPGATSICWDTGADIPDTSTTVTLRVILDDGTVVASTGCTTPGLTIDNTPTCAINAPAMGTTLTGTELINYTIGDPDGNLLDVRFFFSTNGGGSFVLATPAAGINPLFALPPLTTNFSWDTAADIPGMVAGVIFRTDVYDGTTFSTCTEVYDVLNNTAPTCVINAPAPGAMVSGVVVVDVDTTDAEGDPLDMLFEYSTNAGVTWFQMTRFFTSPLPNPATGVAPAAGLIFHWNSSVDLPGGPWVVNVQLTVDDGQLIGTCDPASTITVDNRPPPTCAFMMPAPAGMVSADVPIVFTTTSPSGDMLAASFEFDSGGGFMPATDAGTGALTGNPTASFVAGGTDWTWDSYVDIPGDANPVDFRITLTDVGPDGMLGTADDGPVGTCVIQVDVRNAPTCTITAPAAATLVSGDVNVAFSATSPGGNMLEATFDYDPGGGFMLATDAGTGTETGNPTAVFAAGATDWTWNSDMDIPTSAIGVIFRATVLDVGADGIPGTADDGASSTCTVSIDVDNLPTCTIASPAAASTVMGTTPIMFTPVAPSGNMITASFEFDAGGGFMPATDAGTGTLTGNPTGMFAAGGTDWDWATFTDIPGVVMGVIFRVTITDTGTGQSSSCTVVIDVDNAPTCTVTSPAGAAMVSSTVPIVFDTTSMSGNMLAASFEYDAGGGFMPATDAGTGGLTGNPTAAFAAAVGMTWDWNSPADIPMSANPTVFRVTVTDVGPDGVLGTADDGVMSTCAVMGLDVDNLPTCTITAPAMGAVVIGNQIISVTTTAPSGNMVMLDFDFDAGGGFMVATDAGGGSVVGNPTGCFAAAAVTWQWDSATDVPMTIMTDFRVTVTDCGTGASSTCTVTALDVQNAMACIMDCHWMREMAIGEGFDFGAPTAAALMAPGGISSGILNTTGGGDQFCHPPAGIPFGCVTGPAPGHEPPCVPVLTPMTAAGCGSFFSDDADHVHRVTIPAGITMLTVNTCTPNTFFDTLISVWNCAGVELGCFDPPGCAVGSGGGDTGTIPVIAGDVIYIVIDGFAAASNGSYELIITGF